MKIYSLKNSGNNKSHIKGVSTSKFGTSLLHESKKSSRKRFEEYEVHKREKAIK